MIDRTIKPEDLEDVQPMPMVRDQLKAIAEKHNERERALMRRDFLLYGQCVGQTNEFGLVFRVPPEDWQIPAGADGD